jgi:hypothetical protein
MRRLPPAVLALCAFGLARAAQAQERSPAPNETPPDLEFLEYLGSWQASDEEWFAIRELEGKRAKDGSQERNKPEPERPRDEHEKPK